MNNYLRNVLISSPLMAATLWPFLELAAYLGAAFDIRVALLGALGWWLALLLRLPVIALVRKYRADAGQSLVVAASGPAEELVRLGLLLYLGLTTDSALIAGIGWAAIEIVYAMVQLVGMGVLRDRSDEKAEEAKQLMRLQGMEHVFDSAAPFWSVVERLSANGIHVGMGLLLVINPWLIILAMPLHSGINFLFVRMLRKSFLAAQGTLLFVSGLLLAVVLNV